MEKKFELTDNFVINALGIKLFQIKCTKAFKNANEGDLGGYVEKECFKVIKFMPSCLCRDISLMKIRNKTKKRVRHITKYARHVSLYLLNKSIYLISKMQVQGNAFRIKAGHSFLHSSKSVCVTQWRRLCPCRMWDRRRGVQAVGLLHA